jgi:hypothetical protein
MTFAKALLAMLDLRITLFRFRQRIL